jgi:hypothetical protein
VLVLPDVLDARTHVAKRSLKCKPAVLLTYHLIPQFDAVGFSPSKTRDSRQLCLQVQINRARGSVLVEQDGDISGCNHDNKRLQPLIPKAIVPISAVFWPHFIG